MPAHMHQRSQWILFAALASASAGGFMLLPSGNPWRVWPGGAGDLATDRLFIPALQLLLTVWGIDVCRAVLARRGMLVLQHRTIRWFLVLVGVAVWYGSMSSGLESPPGSRDTRALLWLQTLPLWLWPSGLVTLPWPKLHPSA